MKKTLLSVCFVALSTLSSFSYASESEYDKSGDGDYYNPNFFTTFQVGSLGTGLNLGYQFNPYFDVRANINGLKFHDNYTVNDIKYEGNARLLTAGLLADYYPFANGFRVTAGAYYNGNKINGTGYYDKTYYGINVNDYGHAEASVDYKKFAPYVGFGYQGGTDNGWIFTADIGVMYQDSAKVHYNAVCSDAMLCSLFQDKIEEKSEEQKSQIQHDVDRLKWYPVASIGIGYRF